MAPKYKLTYMNARGLGEPIRYLLEYGGVEWEDVRIERTDAKEIGPFGKVPLLEVDGKTVHQSVAICRYLAKQFKLAGDSDWESLQIDVIVDTIGDMRSQFSNSMTGTQEENDKKKIEFLRETVPYFLSKFEAIVRSNGGHFVNGKLTWADIYWAHMVTVVSSHLGEASAKAVASNFPSLDALQKKVFELPAIKAWIAKRPQTNH